MRTNYLLLFSIVMACAGYMKAGAQNVFINEIHYDNDNADQGEGIEVAGPAGTNLTGWSLVLYNGNGGGVYSTIALSGVLPDQQAGHGTAFFTATGLQNGSPDGIVLLDPSDMVIQFLSYEGAFTATDGPANGLLSEDIGVSESGATAVGNSMQLTGQGNTYQDFTWQADLTATYGAVNIGQTFGEPVVAQPLINEFVFQSYRFRC